MACVLCACGARTSQLSADVARAAGGDHCDGAVGHGLVDRLGDLRVARARAAGDGDLDHARGDCARDARREGRVARCEREVRTRREALRVRADRHAPISWLRCAASLVSSSTGISCERLRASASVMSGRLTPRPCGAPASCRTAMRRVLPPPVWPYLRLGPRNITLGCHGLRCLSTGRMWARCASPASFCSALVAATGASRATSLLQRTWALRQGTEHGARGTRTREGVAHAHDGDALPGDAVRVLELRQQLHVDEQRAAEGDPDLHEGLTMAHAQAALLARLHVVHHHAVRGAVGHRVHVPQVLGVVRRVTLALGRGAAAVDVEKVVEQLAMGAARPREEAAEEVAQLTALGREPAARTASRGARNRGRRIERAGRVEASERDRAVK